MMKNGRKATLAREVGYFFQTQKTGTCSAWQVDVKECPYKSCHTCEPVDCLFGAWSSWSGASCTQLCASF